MIEYTACPYCYNNVEIDLDTPLSLRDFEIYKEDKCNHCGKLFIYKPRVEILAHKNPSDK